MALEIWIVVLGLMSCFSSKEESTPLISHGITTHRWSSFVTRGEGQVDAIKTEVDAYEAAAGRAVAWVAFGHEWETDGRAFPSSVATSIKDRGATPLIFLNLRSVDEGADPIYTLAKIISGEFDSDLAAWADGAKNFGSELIVNWGWEMNGDFNPWNGSHNGGETEGPKNFQKAYRHIIELMDNRGATNIHWGFHVNIPASPKEAWNDFENYYPGNDVIDCTGVSLYGAQAPTDESMIEFISNFDAFYSRLIAMAPDKPVFVFEFATTSINSGGKNQATWADEALEAILSGRWSQVRGFAWWNDYWDWAGDDNPANDTEMRVEAVPDLTTVFKTRLSASNIGDRPPIFK
ncbi:MAG: beta-mannanase [Deltaproteobacteria bacterium]|nr:beta-mannanase [Deltaproteobacteria bacterium]